jgi:hypothetical protein
MSPFPSKPLLPLLSPTPIPKPIRELLNCYKNLSLNQTEFMVKAERPWFSQNLKSIMPLPN